MNWKNIKNVISSDLRLSGKFSEVMSVPVKGDVNDLTLIITVLKFFISFICFPEDFVSNSLNYFLI